MNNDYSNRNYVGATEIVPADSHKSFYKKCYDMFDGRFHACYSYGTCVMVYDTEKDKLIRTWSDDSRTTTRHINGWLAWLELPSMSVAEYRKMDYEEPPIAWMKYHHTFAGKVTKPKWLVCDFNSVWY